MSQVYRLVFRGEVLEGQHPAVVRKRLAQASSFEEAVLDKLFSGRPVVLKRAADTATAARFQALFRKAGARLRVLPVENETQEAAASPASAMVPPVPGSTDDPPPAGAFELLPPGADVLRTEERAPWQPQEVDTGSLALEKARFVAQDPPARPTGPDVSHLTVADPGEDLGPPRREPEHPIRAPELAVAAPGELLAPRAAPPVPAVDFASLRFDVAELGADLDQRQPPAPLPAPDVSHLRLDEPG